MAIKLRKLVVQVDETRIEMGQAVEPPARRAVAIAVIDNPYAGRYEAKLDALIEAGEELGALLGNRCVEALGIKPGDAQSYGKAAIVGIGATDFSTEISRLQALKPDVILAVQSGLTADQYAQLTKIAPTVAQPGRNWQTSWQDQTTLVGKALGRPTNFRSTALRALGGTVAANALRNVWAHAVIFCGHFPDGVDTFDERMIDGETRGDWYIRQMLGSANISGTRTFHTLTGNLSHQIEHHLFPDLPSNRYIEVAPKVREICERYGLPYNTGRFGRQLGSTWKNICVLAVPTRDEWAAYRAG